MILFPPPPAADPPPHLLPDGPINPAFMRNLLHTTAATQPLPADATPDRQADRRLATMHAIAAFQPRGALEARLAGPMVAVNARMAPCFALATTPDADRGKARRDAAQAAALMRCTQATLRGFLRMRTARHKDEEQPSGRAGYWFRDVSVPAPEGDGVPADPRIPQNERQHPMPSGAAAPAVATRHPDAMPLPAEPSPSNARENPIHHEEPPHPSHLDPMQSGAPAPAAAIRHPGAMPPAAAAPGSRAREDPMYHERPPRAAWLNPMQSGEASPTAAHGPPRHPARRIPRPACGKTPCNVSAPAPPPRPRRGNVGSTPCPVSRTTWRTP